MNMVISGTDGLDDRIAVIEKKMQNLEPLVRGLVAEMLDFKAYAMNAAREEGERSRQEMKQGPVSYAAVSPAAPPASLSAPVHTEGTTVVRPRKTPLPAAPAEPEMVRIMQPDGTMKMEPRYGGAIDNSSVGYGRTKKGTAKISQDPNTRASGKENQAGKKK
jgi:uncharacterized membrane protein